MSEKLPYFKFKSSRWLTGDIVYEPFNVQGLFINICAIYWDRDGKLSISDINKRFKNPPELSDLTDRFFSVSDGFISIKFLDEQFAERSQLRCTNSKNGSLGGRPKGYKTKGKKPTANRPLTDRKANESNIEKEKEKKKNKISFPESEFFDKKVFASTFQDWSKEKLKYYYDAADRYSAEGNKYVNWDRAIHNWAAKDQVQGKIKFNTNHHTTIPNAIV